MKWIIVCFMLCCSWIAVEIFVHQNNFNFFGAKVDSEYVMHYNNKLQCAFVIGWYDVRKCMCFLTEDDLRLKDKTLIASDSVMCLNAE